MVLSTEPLHIPVSNTNLHSTSFNFLIRLQKFQISTIESLVKTIINETRHKINVTLINLIVGGETHSIDWVPDVTAYMDTYSQYLSAPRSSPRQTHRRGWSPGCPPWPCQCRGGPRARSCSRGRDAPRTPLGCPSRRPWVGWGNLYAIDNIDKPK